MTAEKELQNRSKLLQLIRENPDLPVIPLVDGEIPGDNSGYWLGSWGTVEIDECLFSKRGIYFKSDDDVFGVLECVLSAAEYYSLPDEDALCRKRYEELPWRKAIVVYITTPD